MALYALYHYARNINKRMNKTFGQQGCVKALNIKGVQLSMISLNRHAALTSYSEKTIDLSELNAAR